MMKRLFKEVSEKPIQLQSVRVNGMINDLTGIYMKMCFCPQPLQVTDGPQLLRILKIVRSLEMGL